MNDFVALNYIEEYDVKKIEEALRASISLLNLEKVIKPKMKVLIKVNLPYEASPNQAITTNPAVVCALANVLTSMGVKCIVADSPFSSKNSLDSVYFQTGMLDAANRSNFSLNHDLSSSEIEIPSGTMAKSLLMLNVLDEVDAIVNVGKVKIDKRFGYLGAASNLLGLLPGEYKDLILNRLATLKDFNNLLIDIFTTIKSKLMFNVLDGIVAQEAGDSQRVLSCLAMSENLFALDAALINILSIPMENTILNQAAERELINLSHPYKTLNEEPAKFKVEDFALADFNNSTLVNKNARQQKSYFNSHQKRVVIKPKKCKGCGVCSKICPTGAIMMKYDKNGELFASVDYSKCIFCFKCKEACPYQVVDFHTPLGYKSLMREIKTDGENK